MFHNALADRLREELARAARLGVSPRRIGDPGFAGVAAEGTVKWAVTVAGELLIVPKYVRGEELPHTVLTNGEPVLAAGEAEIVRMDDQYALLDINHHSGHYRPDRQSLRIGERAFADRGITQL